MLLSGVGLHFKVVVPDHPEHIHENELPKDIAKRLALEKAMLITSHHPDSWIIAADTIVVLGGKILGKPNDRNEAFEMLKALQGKTHEVWGGFAIVNSSEGVSHSEVHKTEVQFIHLSDNEIKSYIETGEPLDKAGAYGIQGLGTAFVSRVSGSYTNVMGLNLAALLVALKEFGVLK